MVRIAVVCLGLAVTACGAEKGQQPVTAPPDVTALPEATVTPLSDDVSSVRIAKSIREKCGLSAAEAYFEYDSAAIDDQARRVLGKLAERVVPTNTLAWMPARPARRAGTSLVAAGVES